MNDNDVCFARRKWQRPLSTGVPLKKYPDSFPPSEKKQQLSVQRLTTGPEFQGVPRYKLYRHTVPNSEIKEQTPSEHAGRIMSHPKKEEDFNS